MERKRIYYISNLLYMYFKKSLLNAEYGLYLLVNLSKNLILISLERLLNCYIRSKSH